MSRTYREHLDWQAKVNGRYLTSEEFRNFVDDSKYYGATRGWRGRYFVNRHDRDKKPWDKPSGEFKRLNRRWERSKVRQAMESGKDIPVFHKTNQWEWT